MGGRRFIAIHRESTRHAGTGPVKPLKVDPRLSVTAEPETIFTKLFLQSSKSVYYLRRHAGDTSAMIKAMESFIMARELTCQPKTINKLFIGSKGEFLPVKLDIPSITEDSLRSKLIVFLLIMTAAMVVYFKTLSYGFMATWDDSVYVLDNVSAHGFSWEHIKTAFSSYYASNYAPLHIVSYMLDHALWGLNPSGYIAHNITLHGLNGFLLYLMLRRLSLRLYPAILSALLFVLHPVQVESVVWISQRKTVLAMFFFLLSIHCYSYYRSSTGDVNRKQYALSLFFFLCSLLSKSVVVVLPAILFLYDHCISRRNLLKSITDKLPFIVMTFIACLIALLSQSEEYGQGGRSDFHGGGTWSTFLTMLPVFISYIRMVLVPSGLSIVYAPQIKSSVDGEVFFALVILCSLSAVGYRLYRSSKSAFFWYAAIPIMILPVSQVIPIVTMMNDRYLYFPMLGVVACCGLLVQHFLDRIDIRWRKSAALCFFMVVGLYGVLSFQRTSVWRNSFALWQDAVEKQPQSAVAWLALGEVYEEQGEPFRALQYAERAREICRGIECHHALEKLSTLYMQRGSVDRAEKSADELIRLFPKSANGYILKGYLKYQQRDLLLAEKLFLEGVRLDHNQPASLNALGNIYLATGRPAIAIEKLKAAEMLGNPSPELYYSMACAEAMLQKREDALHHLDKALRLGYKKYDSIMTDSGLSGLRGDPEFTRLMEKYVTKR